MSGRCSITGKKPSTGRSYTTRGVPKWKGGIGVKVTGKTKRWFRPNLQRLKIVDENGTVRRAWVSTQAIRSGLVTKAPKQSLVAKIRAEAADFKKSKKSK
jgi:large subunit ribosomal protein L28